MPIYRLGDEATDGAMTAVDEEGGGLCGGGMCSDSASAANSAQKALGPAATPISQAIMSSLQADKSPAGQAQLQSSQAYNAQVDKDNSNRKAIIDQFVKDAIGGKVTKQTMQMGDKAKAEYQKLIDKYGPDVKSMTLAQVTQKYPNDVQAVVTSLAQVFPGLQGKSYDQIMASIPDTFKSMTMNDLEAVLPDSSWAGQSTASGVVAAATSPLGLTTIAVAGIGLVAMIMLLGKKKKEPSV